MIARPMGWAMVERLAAGDVGRQELEVDLVVQIYPPDHSEPRQNTSKTASRSSNCRYRQSCGLLAASSTPTDERGS
jgi:hypothetical protein